MEGVDMLDIYKIKCRRCGRFEIDGLSLTLLKNKQMQAADQYLLPYLSAYTRQATDRGIVVRLDAANWLDLARGHTTTPVSQKLTKLLELMASRSPYPGAKGAITDIDYPLVDASSFSEVVYLLKHLTSLDCAKIDSLSGAYSTRREEHIVQADEKGPGFDYEDGYYTYSLTVKGWERLEPLPGGNGIPGRCFVAMSFDPSLYDAYELGIRLAIIDCGFQPVRIDQVHHNEKICDKILAEIRLAQLIVADFTLQRAGVYFEAGFGAGLGRPIIWMCRDDDFDNTHFDTRQYNHIVWSTPEDLRAKLTNRIRATISR
jgi:hypothetical protein